MTRNGEEERSERPPPECDRQPVRGSVGVGVGVLWLALCLLNVAMGALATLALIDLAIQAWGRR